MAPNLPGFIWSSECPTGTRCPPPKPHKLVKQFPVCSVRLTRLLPGGSFFSFCTYRSWGLTSHHAANGQILCSIFWRKIKHFTTKQRSFALSVCSFVSFPATFENFNNYSLSQGKESKTWLSDMRGSWTEVGVTKHTRFCSKNTFYTLFRHTSQLFKLLVHKNKNKMILRPLHCRITEKQFLLISLSQASRHHTAACPCG